jgi:hypothetical protein
LLTDNALHESALLDSGEVETEEARKRRKRVVLYLLQPTSLPWRLKHAARMRHRHEKRGASVEQAAR